MFEKVICENFLLLFNGLNMTCDKTLIVMTCGYVFMHD